MQIITGLTSGINPESKPPERSTSLWLWMRGVFINPLHPLLQPFFENRPYLRWQEFESRRQPTDSDKRISVRKADPILCCIAYKSLILLTLSDLQTIFLSLCDKPRLIFARQMKRESIGRLVSRAKLMCTCTKVPAQKWANYVAEIVPCNYDSMRCVANWEWCYELIQFYETDVGNRAKFAIFELWCLIKFVYLFSR